MRKPRLVVPLSLLLTMPVLLLAETHRLIPQTFYNTFSRVHIHRFCGSSLGTALSLRRSTRREPIGMAKPSRAVRIQKLAPSTSKAQSPVTRSS